MDSDVIVVGGGVVGAAVAMGLAKRNLAVTVLDGSDTDFSAARANFGLVWAQGKGDGKPEYQRLTQSSIRLWPAFTDELRQASRIDVQYENGGDSASVSAKPSSRCGRRISRGCSESVATPTAQRRCWNGRSSSACCRRCAWARM